MDAAVIGCGKFGYYHAEKYAAMDDVSLACVVDSDRKRAKEVAERFHCEFTDNYHDLGRLDLISIATPNATHYKIAKHFIKQGCDVLIEKPMTQSHAELSDLVKLAREEGVQLWGGFLERYNSIFKQAFENNFKIQEIYTHRSCEYRTCRENEDVIFDLMIHDIFLTLMVFGPYLGYELEVEKSNSLSNCNDAVRAKIKFEDGRKADLTARRDIQQKTKLFCVKAKQGSWQVYNLKKKENDTLREELVEFCNGGYFHIDLALQSLKMAERILKK